MTVNEVIAELAKVRTVVSTVNGFNAALNGAKAGMLPWSANALETCANSVTAVADTLGESSITITPGEGDNTATLAQCSDRIANLSTQLNAASVGRAFGSLGGNEKADALKTIANGILDVAATLNVIAGNIPAGGGGGIGGG